MVLIGLFFMIISISISLTIKKSVSQPISRKWSIITCLMILFLMGYSAFLFLQFQSMEEYLELITGIVFLGGALFVFSVMGLINNTLILMNKASQSLKNKIIELQKAQEEVNLLSGLLPICATCKKIRDDNGYWNRMESYISSHSKVKFSHGICPDCAQKSYPDLYKEITENNN